MVEPGPGTPVPRGGGPYDRAMAEVTIFHNPRCSNSRNALAVADQRGVDVDVVRYLEQRPDRATLTRVVSLLEDPVEDLVRKDARFGELGLDAGVYEGDADAVVDLLVEHPELLQRPVLVKGSRAIIGRPRDRVVEFLA
jgi:arsenate reductase (glutaredoxin)